MCSTTDVGEVGLPADRRTRGFVARPAQRTAFKTMGDFRRIPVTNTTPMTASPPTIAGPPVLLPMRSGPTAQPTCRRRRGRLGPRKHSRNRSTRWPSKSPLTARLDPDGPCWHSITMPRSGATAHAGRSVTSFPLGSSGLRPRVRVRRPARTRHVQGCRRPAACGVSPLAEPWRWLRDSHQDHERTQRALPRACFPVRGSPSRRASGVRRTSRPHRRRR